MKKIIFSAALLMIVGVITANVKAPKCYKEANNLNGVCYHVYGPSGEITSTNCSDPGPGSSAAKDCTYGD